MQMWFLSSCFVMLSCSLPASDARPKAILDYADRGTRYTNIAVTREVLQPADVERWGRLLDASEAQLQLMQAQFAHFVEEHNALLDREAPRLLRASAEIHLAREAEGGYTDAHGQRMTALLQHCARLRRQLEQVEQHYINNIESFLTEQQVQRLPILRNEAVRRQAHVNRGTMPWASADVRTLWEQTDQALVSPEDREWIYEILWEHDLAITPIIRSMTDSFWRGRMEVARLVPDWQSGVMSHNEYIQRNELSKSRFLRSLTRLSALNESAAMQIAEALPEQTADEFLALAKSAAFPQLYPDRESLHEVFANILADEELEQDTAAAVKELANVYDDEYRRLADEIERFYFDFARQGTLDRYGFFPQDLPAALEPMLQQRRELSQQWMQQLAETVGEDVLSRHGLNADETDADEADEQAEA